MKEFNYKIAIFPGSFEHFHQGHVSVLKKAINIFEIIYVVVSNNEAKKNSEIKKRYENVINNDFIKNNNSKIKVLINNGLTVDVLKELNCYFIIRGMRNKKDFHYELNLYDEYKKMYNDFEIIYFLSDNDKRNISSSNLIREK